jgi:hypothetical protein
MKLPAIFVLLGLLMAAISAFAAENTDTLPRQTAAPSSGIDRRPGILPDWEAHANIVTLEELEAEAAKRDQR